jgi:hypothetical protein
MRPQSDRRKTGFSADGGESPRPLDSRPSGHVRYPLFGTCVDDKGLEHLAGLTDLRALYLESTPVGDAGLVHLRRLTNLRSLALTGTRVTNAGLVHLKGLTCLQALDLSYTGVTEDGINELRRALPGAEITPDPARAATGALSSRVGVGK